jgi:hypothetical protein
MGEERACFVRFERVFLFFLPVFAEHLMGIVNIIVGVPSAAAAAAVLLRTTKTTTTYSMIMRTTRGVVNVLILMYL